MVLWGGCNNEIKELCLDTSKMQSRLIHPEQVLRLVDGGFIKVKLVLPAPDCDKAWLLNNNDSKSTSEPLK